MGYDIGIIVVKQKKLLFNDSVSQTILRKERYCVRQQILKVFPGIHESPLQIHH